MKSEIENGINYWVDENDNRWNSGEFTEEEAEKLSKTLIDCTECVDCKGCVGCVSCLDCVNLENSKAAMGVTGPTSKECVGCTRPICCEVCEFYREYDRENLEKGYIEPNKKPNTL